MYLISVLYSLQKARLLFADSIEETGNSVLQGWEWKGNTIIRYDACIIPAEINQNSTDSSCTSAGE